MARADALLSLGLGLAAASCGPSLVDLSRNMAAAQEAATAGEPVRERERTFHDRGRTRPATDCELLVFPDGLRLKNGRDRAWFADGTPRYERSFDLGEPTGLWRSWHRNGNLEFEHAFDPDAPTPMSWWHAGGQLSSEGQARMGLRLGPWISWHENGSRSSAGSYRSGVRHGAWSFWYEDGSLAEQGEYRDGLRTGEWLRWLPGERPDAAAEESPRASDQ